MTVIVDRSENGSAVAQNPAWARYAWRVVQVLVFLLLVYFALPQRFGGKTEFSIVNGKSMEPTFHTGDLVLARPSDRYEIGDVVVYRIPDEKYPKAFRIVHRLKVRLPNGNFLAQGDNNEGTDAWELSADNIVGKQVLMIPKGGVVMSRLLSPLFIGTYIGLLVFWAVWTDDEDDEDNDRNDNTSDNTSDNETQSDPANSRESPPVNPDAIVAGDSIFFGADLGSTYAPRHHDRHLANA
jgi:signal peptidase I